MPTTTSRTYHILHVRETEIMRGLSTAAQSSTLQRVSLAHVLFVRWCVNRGGGWRWSSDVLVYCARSPGSQPSSAVVCGRPSVSSALRNRRIRGTRPSSTQQVQGQPGLCDTLSQQNTHHCRAGLHSCCPFKQDIELPDAARQSLYPF